MRSPSGAGSSCGFVFWTSSENSPPPPPLNTHHSLLAARSLCRSQAVGSFFVGDSILFQSHALNLQQLGIVLGILRLSCLQARNWASKNSTHNHPAKLRVSLSLSRSRSAVKRATATGRRTLTGAETYLLQGVLCPSFLCSEQACPNIVFM